MCGRPESVASKGIHEPKFSDSSSDEEFALPAHFKLTLVEKPSGETLGCHRSLRSEVLVQEEDYINLAADDDENDDQKPDVASEINPVFANKRVSPSNDSNSTSNSDHGCPGRPSSDSDYSILYDKVCCIIALLTS